MIKQLLSVILVVILCSSTKADILLNFIDQNSSNTVGPNFTGSILNLSGVNDIDSLTLNYVKFGGALNNVTAELRIFDHVDPYSASNIFYSAPIETHTFNMGNYNAGLIRTNFTFDFASVGKQFQVNDSFGIELTFKANGLNTNNVRPVLNLHNGWNGTTGNDFWYSDTDFDSIFTVYERDGYVLQWRVDGTSVSAVPEPSSLILCGSIVAGFCLRMRKK